MSTPSPTIKMPPASSSLSPRLYWTIAMTPAKPKTLPSTRTPRNQPLALVDAWTLRTSSDGVGFLEAPGFSAFPWLIHGFSTSQGGVSPLHGSKVLNLGFTGWDAREN